MSSTFPPSEAPFFEPEGGSLVDSLGADLLTNADGSSFLLDEAPASERFNGLPKDSSWVRQSFIVGNPENNDTGLSTIDISNRRFSSATLKYTDSSLGGNNCINPPPQYTRYADVRVAGIHPDAQNVSILSPKTYAHLGQGRYYSEAIDDNSQIIHMRFGVASYNSLLQFFSGFYSGNLAAAARAGRFTDDIVQNFFTFAGNAIGVAIAPLFIIPLALLLLGTAARYFMNMPGSRFYNITPRMPIYWNAVTSLVNQLAVNSGLSSFVNTVQANEIMKGSADGSLTATTTLNTVGHFLPKGLIKDNGTIDVYAMANRTNRMSIKYDNLLAAAFKSAGPNDDYFAVIRNFVASTKAGANLNTSGGGLAQYLERVFGNAFNKSDKGADSFEQELRKTTPNPDGSNKANPDADYVAPDPPGFFDHLNANFNDGGEFASFRVDYTGPVENSFSNSASENSMAAKINSMSKSNRDLRVNMADGNAFPGADAIVGAVKGIIGGVSEILQIEGIAAVAGSAFIDIPKNWESSSASLPKSNYTMTLISPYGNPVSQLFNIWVPLSMLLAGVLPLATGKQSHTSPFLVELYDRGRSITRLGIIDSLSITRGTSNLGYNNSGQALAIDVSFSVLDLSGVVAMPVQPGFSLAATIGSLFDGENSFTDYLMALSAMQLKDTVYRVPMLQYQINRAAADLDSFFSTSHFASYFASLPGVNVLSGIYRGTDKK